MDASAFLTTAAATAKPGAGYALLCTTLDEVRAVAARVVAAEAGAHVRAVLAPFVPSATVAFLSGLGVAALEVDAAGSKALRDGKDGKEGRAARSITLPAPGQWSERGEHDGATVSVGSTKLSLAWLAIGVERAWVTTGTAAPARDVAKVSARR